MWWYTLATLVLWVVDPELRRLFGWYFGYPSVDVIGLLPFLAVLPHAYSLTYGGGWRRLPGLLKSATWIWLGAFTYGLIIAIVDDDLLPGAYDFANFVIPIGIGLWVAASETEFTLAYSRITRLLFTLTTVISVYGVIQYVVAPAWDTLWLQNVIADGSLSFGRPLPFQIRVFSMLGSPGPFGSFMALMLLLALPQLSLRRPWELAQIPFWLIAFGLSLDRAGWLLFASGAVVYMLLTPRRGALLASVSLTTALLAGLVVILPLAVGNEGVLTSLGDRFTTFSDLDTDRSGNDRRALYDTGVSLVSEAPFGHGLGVLGGATKLGEAGARTDFDSGVLARLVEMGLPGSLLFVITAVMLAAGTLRVWRKAARVRDGTLQSIAGMAFAVLVSLFGSELFGDINGLLILTLWLICGLAIRGQARTAPRSLKFAHA